MITSRRLHGPYHIEVKWVDVEAFDLCLHGHTNSLRSPKTQSVFKIAFPFRWVPYLVRELVKEWVRSKGNRLAEIEEIDEALPKENP